MADSITDPNQILGNSELRTSLHPVSDVTRWRMVRRGEFPAPIRISPGRIGWRRGDVEQWLERRSGR